MFLPAQDSSAVMWSVSPLVSVTEWMWKIHVVGSGQGYEGVFAYEACSDNVEGLHMADGVKWPIVKSFWLEPHLNSILEGTDWSVTKLELGKNKHTAVWWWGKDAGMNHSQVIRWWNYILWVLMEKKTVHSPEWDMLLNKGMHLNSCFPLQVMIFDSFLCLPAQSAAESLPVRCTRTMVAYIWFSDQL